MHAFDRKRWTEVGLAFGYKIGDFASRAGAQSILQLAQARERHAELHWLRKALHKHNAIPNSFDDRLPEETSGDDNMPRLLIGSTYLIPDQNGKDTMISSGKSILLVAGKSGLNLSRRGPTTLLCRNSTKKRLRTTTRPGWRK